MHIKVHPISLSASQRFLGENYPHVGLFRVTCSDDLAAQPMLAWVYDMQAVKNGPAVRYTMTLTDGLDLIELPAPAQAPTTEAFAQPATVTEDFALRALAISANPELALQLLGTR